MEFIFKYQATITLFLISLFAGSAGLDSLRIETRDGKTFILHEVEQGETLYRISRRYGADISEVIAQNAIVDNKIDLGQVLEIPTTKLATAEKRPEPVDQIHIVEAKETLYGISKKYGVTIDQLKIWNSLSSNAISLGQTLIVKKETGTRQQEVAMEIVKPVLEKPVVKPAPKKDPYTIYTVQTGDGLESIARKFNVRVDSIVIWNGLKNTYLAIGQKLKVKGELDTLAQTVQENSLRTEYGTVTRQVDQSGFTRIIEEGVAKRIEQIEETGKYLALHRTLKIGTLVEVRNLMNNKKIFVRIVGKLPETGLNENTLIRMSPICFKTLGVIDPLTRVEISYYEE